jgi:hypothetical protein
LFVNYLMCENNLAQRIGDITYHHKYYPIRYDLPNVPWYQPNSAPYARVSIMPTIFPPRIGTDLQSFSQPPSASCSRGYYPVVGAAGVGCCNNAGGCVFGD